MSLDKLKFDDSQTAHDQAAMLAEAISFAELKLIQESLNSSVRMFQEARRYVIEHSTMDRYYESKMHMISALEFTFRRAIEQHPSNPSRHVQAATHQRG